MYVVHVHGSTRITCTHVVLRVDGARWGILDGIYVSSVSETGLDTPVSQYIYYLPQLEILGTLTNALRAYLTFKRALSVIYACLSLPPSLGLSST